MQKDIDIYFYRLGNPEGHFLAEIPSRTIFYLKRILLNESESLCANRSTYVTARNKKIFQLFIVMGIGFIGALLNSYYLLSFAIFISAIIASLYEIFYFGVKEVYLYHFGQITQGKVLGIKIINGVWLVCEYNYPDGRTRQIKLTVNRSTASEYTKSLKSGDSVTILYKKESPYIGLIDTPENREIFQWVKQRSC